MQLFKKRKTIYREEGKPYLIRWNLFECSLFSIKVHKILESDADCPHDHPWAFVSLILRGGYVEHREHMVVTGVGYWDQVHMDGPVLVYGPEMRSRIYSPGNILYRRATDKHKLEIHQPAWTLVLTFKKTQEWGFFTSKGKVHWEDYQPTNSCE